MQAVSTDGKSLRYILALGLRTLTLQTGDEYRERIHLDRNDLAVLIGSSAVTKLHEENKEADKGKEKKGNRKGYLSEEPLLPEEWSMWIRKARSSPGFWISSSIDR